MRMSTDHPSFISYLNEVTNNVIDKLEIENYFYLTDVKKKNTQFITFTLIEKNIKNRVTILSEQLKTFLVVLIKKNEKLEKYEVAALLNDIINNFEEIQSKKDKLSKIAKTAIV